MRRTLVALSIICTVVLAACNGPEEAKIDDIGKDPISQNPSPDPDPTGTPTPPPTDSEDLYTGPADVLKYVLKFIDDGKIQGVDVVPDMAGPKLQIRIASLDAYGASTIGLCQSGGGLRRVTLDPDFWNNVSETQRELLMHHELGHCVLYRAHSTAKLSTGAVASIMYPIIMGSSTYLNDYDYYQEELFSYSHMVDPDMPVTHICDETHL